MLSVAAAILWVRKAVVKVLFDCFIDKFNTYVTLKLSNSSASTVSVKSATPSWQQDFLL